MNKTQRQEQAALLLAAGYSQVEVAEALDVSARTVRRWQRTPEFQAKVAERQQNIIQSAQQWLSSNVLRAAQLLVELMEHGTNRDKVRLQACLALLDRVGLPQHIVADEPLVVEIKTVFPETRDN